MSRQQLRANQLIHTFGPGSMVDLPANSIIVAGLERWSYDGSKVCDVIEPRLSAKIGRIFGRKSIPLKCPPPSPENVFVQGQRPSGVGGYIFPHWFIVQYVELSPGKHKRRRLVYKDELNDRSKFFVDDKARSVVPVRFVRACRKGHVGDIQWRLFVHRGEDMCFLPIWMEERGTTGDLSDIWIVCQCGANRCVREATHQEALGKCNGSRPWLADFDLDKCGEDNRLLIRTASNAYFAQVLSVISIPDTMSKAEEKVLPLWESHFCKIDSLEKLHVIREMVPDVEKALGELPDADVWAVIQTIREGKSVTAVAKPVKELEFDRLCGSAGEAAGDKAEGDFFARELDRSKWNDPRLDAVEKVVLVQKMREVAALIGFTRFEPVTSDLLGELELNVQRAAISKNTNWIPAVENRGEGVFLKVKADHVAAWATTDPVIQRAGELERAFQLWRSNHPNSKQAFPGAAYVMLHTFSHLLISAISLECGYPLSSLRERIYAPMLGNAEMANSYGILIYTSSSGAEGTLGSLVQASRSIRKHILRAFELGTLCSNDPVCSSSIHADEDAGSLSGSACHGCVFISETSCERFNQFLDRSLVVPTIDRSEAAFFRP